MHMTSASRSAATPPKRLVRAPFASRRAPGLAPVSAPPLARASSRLARAEA